MRIVRLAFTLLLSPLVTSAACNLPALDGAGNPSRPNIFGEIERVAPPYLFIRNGRTHSVEQVSISKIKEVFTVYGGDAPLEELKPRLQVWVWFEQCRRPPSGIASAAYFQIFSIDPLDRAKLDREGNIVSVPRH